MTKNEAKKILGEITDKLSEHFDSSQVLVSWNEDGDTLSLEQGCGDWHARRGLAQQFIEADKERNAQSVQ